MHSRTRWNGAAALAVTTGLLLAGCATGGDAAPAATDTNAASSPTAVDAATPRVTVTYDGGILVLDAETLEVVGDLPIDGFTRLNAAGDGRHVLVTVPEGFQVLDAGTWTDHGDSYVADPELTDLVFEADTAGHVVRHGETTVLFADGTGDITIFDQHDLLESEGELPETETVTSAAAHHGVAIELQDGTLLATVGSSEGRNGIRILDADRNEIATSDQCPGVHGEGTAANEAVVFGCENGPIVVRDGAIEKIVSPDAYGRLGNAYVSETSPVAVMDYKDDPDAEGYLLHRIALVDTEAVSMQVIDLPEGVEYTYRGVARGPEGDALIIATDGSLHVMDETTGEITNSIPVIDAWEGPEEWQDPQPVVHVLGDIAYVTDPAANSIHAVDLTTGEVVNSVELDGTPNEMAIAVG